jgi:hypothetical protein
MSFVRRFGLHRDFEKHIAACSISSIVQLNPDEFIACSNKEMWHITRSRPPLPHRYQFLTCTSIPDLGILLAVTVGVPNLVVLNGRVSGFPVLHDDLRLKSAFVSQLIYSQSTNTLITAGVGVDIYDFRMLPGDSSGNLRPALSLRGSVESSLLDGRLCRVYFDAARHRFLVPTACGYVLYSISGHLIQSNTAISTNAFRTSCCIHAARKGGGSSRRKQDDDMTSVVVNPFKRLLATDGEGKARLWHPSGHLFRTFSTPARAFLFSEFVNLEFVVAVTTTQTILLLDIRSGKSMKLATLPRDPDYVAFFADPTPRIVVVMGLVVTFYEIDVPWRLWTSVPSVSRSIKRYPAPSAPARVVILTRDNTVEMVQPQTGNLICNAGLNRPGGVVGLEYDRGCFVTGNSMLRTPFSGERLLLLLDDESLCEMRANAKGFAVTRSVDVKAVMMTIAFSRERKSLGLCCVSKGGELLVYDFEDYGMVTRVVLDCRDPQSVFFDGQSNSVVLVCADRLLQISFDNFQTLHTEIVDRPTLVGFDDGLLIVGTIGNRILVRRIVDGRMSEVATVESMNKIVCVAAQYDTFVYADDRGSIRFGRTFNEMFLIEVPFPVFAVGFLGSMMDLLVGLDTEIMIIRRDDVFPDFQAAPPLDLDSGEAAEEVFCKRAQADEPALLAQAAPPIENIVLPEKPTKIERLRMMIAEHDEVKKKNQNSFVPTAPADLPKTENSKKSKSKPVTPGRAPAGSEQAAQGKPDDNDDEGTVVADEDDDNDNPGTEEAERKPEKNSPKKRTLRLEPNAKRKPNQPDRDQLGNSHDEIDEEENDDNDDGDNEEGTVGEDGKAARSHRHHRKPKAQANVSPTRLPRATRKPIKPPTAAAGDAAAATGEPEDDGEEVTTAEPKAGGGQESDSDSDDQQSTPQVPESPAPTSDVKSDFMYDFREENTEGAFPRYQFRTRLNSTLPTAIPHPTPPPPKPTKEESPRRRRKRTKVRRKPGLKPLGNIASPPGEESLETGATAPARGQEAPGNAAPAGFSYARGRPQDARSNPPPKPPTTSRRPPRRILASLPNQFPIDSRNPQFPQGDGRAGKQGGRAAAAGESSETKGPMTPDLVDPVDVPMPAEIGVTYPYQIWGGVKGEPTREPYKPGMYTEMRGESGEGRREGIRPTTPTGEDAGQQHSVRRARPGGEDEMAEGPDGGEFAPGNAYAGQLTSGHLGNGQFASAHSPDGPPGPGSPHEGQFTSAFPGDGRFTSADSRGNQFSSHSGDGQVTSRSGDGEFASANLREGRFTSHSDDGQFTSSLHGGESNTDLGDGHPGPASHPRLFGSADDRDGNVAGHLGPGHQFDSASPALSADDQLFDCEGHPLHLTGNMHFFALGAVELNSSLRPFRIEAVYDCDGLPCGFVQIFTDNPLAATVVPPNGAPVPAATACRTTEFYDSTGRPLAVGGFVSSGGGVRVLEKGGAVLSSFFDEFGHPITLSRLVSAHDNTVVTDPDGRVVDVSRLFGPDGRPLDVQAVLTEIGHFTDPRGEKVECVRDRQGRPISISKVLHNRAAFDARGRAVSQTVFSDASGDPVYHMRFTPSSVYDATGREVPQTRVCESYVYGSLGKPGYFDENGRPMVLHSRVSLFQFCDHDGKLMQRKVVFDASGRAVGFVLLQMDRDRPRAVFCGMPIGARGTADRDRRKSREKTRRIPEEQIAGFSDEMRGEIRRLERIVPLWPPFAGGPENGIYDLAQMRRIAFETSKKVKPVGVRPVGDIGLAVKIVKPKLN